MNLERLGTKYGGWFVENPLDLTPNSVVYSGGVGEDISFDLLLSHKYNPNIYLIDPTARAISHFNGMRESFQHNKPLPDDVSDEYKSVIGCINPFFEKIRYEEVGLWNSNTTLTFYEPLNKQHVSHTFIPNMYAPVGVVDVPVVTIKHLMEKHGHTHVDLLKIDIEGSEIAVVNQMLDDGIFPTHLCIEFDLYLKQKDTDQSTQKCLHRLQKCGYTILFNDNMNITLKRIS